MCQEEELLVLKINEKQKKSKVRSYRHTNTKQGRKNKYIYIYIYIYTLYIYIYIYIYINLRRTQTGKGLADNLANLRTGTGSKAINSVTQKLIDKGIENIPKFFKYDLSEIRNKNVQ